MFHLRIRKLPKEETVIRLVDRVVILTVLKAVYFSGYGCFDIIDGEGFVIISSQMFALGHVKDYLLIGTFDDQTRRSNSYCG